MNRQELNARVIKLFETYAEKLEQIVEKAKSVKTGDSVSWGSSGGTARGKVTKVITNGSEQVPGSSFKITGTPTTTTPSVTSSAATLVATTTATINGNVTADGGSTITERGFVYKASSGVTINDNKTVVPGTTGAYALGLSSLTTGATYYFKAYAINSAGTTLSNEQSFTTGAVAGPTLTPATVATVDTAFEVTFPDDATWRDVITEVKVDGVALTGGYAVSSGKITFTPSASVPTAALQGAGTKSITVSATGSNDATVSQNLGAGQASKLVITTQPASTTSSSALVIGLRVNITPALSALTRRCTTTAMRTGPAAPTRWR